MKSECFSCCPKLALTIALGIRAVHGLDATAAQTFGTLWNMLEALGVELVITHMKNPEMEKLLRAHGVIGANCCMCAAPTSGSFSSSRSSPVLLLVPVPPSAIHDAVRPRHHQH